MVQEFEPTSEPISFSVICPNCGMRLEVVLDPTAVDNPATNLVEISDNCGNCGTPLSIGFNVVSRDTYVQTLSM